MRKPKTFVEIEFKDIPKYLNKGYVIVEETFITKTFFYMDNNCLVKYVDDHIYINDRPTEITNNFTIKYHENCSYGAFSREEFETLLRNKF